jgi:hypothetical protein
MRMGGVQRAVTQCGAIHLTARGADQYVGRISAASSAIRHIKFRKSKTLSTMFGFCWMMSANALE